jgi:hypothetical protein
MHGLKHQTQIKSPMRSIDCVLADDPNECAELVKTAACQHLSWGLAIQSNCSGACSCSEQSTTNRCTLKAVNRIQVMSSSISERAGDRAIFTLRHVCPRVLRISRTWGPRELSSQCTYTVVDQSCRHSSLHLCAQTPVCSFFRFFNSSERRHQPKTWSSYRVGNKAILAPCTRSSTTLCGAPD